MAQDPEVKIQLNADGTALKAAEDLAAALRKATVAEEAYQKTLAKRAAVVKANAKVEADMVKAGVIAARNLTPEQAGRQRSGLRDNSLLDDLFNGTRSPTPAPVTTPPPGRPAGKPPTAPKTLAERVTAERARLEDKSRFDDALVQNGLKAAPAAAKTVQQQAAAQIATATHNREIAREVDRQQGGFNALPGVSAGKEFLAANAVKIAAGFAVAYAAKRGIEAGADYGVSRGATDADAYMTAAQKTHAKNTANPLLPFYGTIQKLHRSQFTGEESRYQQAVKTGQMNEIESGNEGRILSARAEGDADEVAAARRGKAYEGFRGERMKNLDRSTVTSERLYQEESRLIPLRQQQVITTKNRVLADRKVLDLEDQERQLKAGSGRLRGELEGVIKGRMAMGGRMDINARADIEEAFAEEARIRPLLDAANAEYVKSTHRTRAGREEAARAGGTERGAGIATAQENFAIAQGREDKAQGQAQNLGSMSVLDIMAGQNAVLAAKQIGYENLSQQEKGSYKGIAPDQARKEEERIGERIAKSLAPQLPEYRDNLSDARANTNAAREESTKLQEQDVSRQAKDMAGAVAGVLDKVIAQFKLELEAMKSKLESDAGKRNNAN